MKIIRTKARWAGLMIILGVLAGIFSVAPSVDTANYLTEAAANSSQVIIAALSQLMMAFAYLAFAIVIYPLVKPFGKTLSQGFLSMRIIAVAMVVFGVIVLMAILTLSQEYVSASSEDLVLFETFGNVLKITRDHINHVFMILVLCGGNFLLYILFIRSGIVPVWISVPGLFAVLLSAVGSLLLLFQVIEVITFEYLILNMPTATLDIILAIWLIIKGIDQDAWLIATIDD